MDEYYKGPRTFPQITVGQYNQITNVANSGAFGQINYVHGFGAIGYQEIKTWQGITKAPNAPVERAPEPIKEKGPRLHAPGQAGFR